MARRSKIVVTREGLYFLAVLALVFVGALVRGVNLLILVGGLMIGPLLINWRLIFSCLRGLRFERRLPRHLAAGDLLVVNVVAHNPRRRLAVWSLVVEDTLRREDRDGQRSGAELATSVHVPYLPAGEQRKASYRGVLLRRGRYRIGPLWLSTAFPFGLLRRYVRMDQFDRLTVLPRLGRLQPGWTARRQALAGADVRRRRRGSEGDFFGLRAWQAGDSRRHIDWRSTARAGELMVRQFEQPRSRDLAIVLDLALPAEPTDDQRDNVELAVSFAATVAAELCRAGGSTLQLWTHEGAVGGAAGSALLNEALERLAVAAPREASHAAELLLTAWEEMEPGAEIVLVTTTPVDLNDRQRFASIWNDPAKRQLVGRTLVVDASSAELSRYFTAE